MTKRILSVLLASVIILGTLTLTGCDFIVSIFDSEHEHTWGEWKVLFSFSKNDCEKTFYIRRCYDCVVIDFNRGRHDYRDYERNHLNHWRECKKCDYQGDAEEHIKNGTRCEACGLEFQDILFFNCEHNFVEERCSICGVFSEKAFEYQLLEDNTYAVMSIKSKTPFNLSIESMSSIYIPHTYNGIPVTAMDERLLRYEKIKTIFIPDTVKSIQNIDNIINLGSEQHIENIWVDVNNEFYHVKNNCLIETNSGALIRGNNKSVIPNYVTSIQDSAFAGCNGLTHIIIPDSVTHLGPYAFWNCSSLQTVVIGSNVVEYHSPFEGCTSLTSITVSENNKYYKSIDGNLYTKDGKRLILYAAGKKDIYFKIPDGVIYIDCAFQNCDNLQSVAIPDSVTSIVSAFSGCDSLTNIVIPNSITSIGSQAFSSCSSLTNIVIPNSVTSIGDAAFSDCDSLTNVAIGNGVTSIGGLAFHNCDSLTNIVIPNSVTSIGNSAFSNCDNLQSVVIPNSVTYIGRQAFVQCDQVIIYCKMERSPSTWELGWDWLDLIFLGDSAEDYNGDKVNVVWGYNHNDE